MSKNKLWNAIQQAFLVTGAPIAALALGGVALPATAQNAAATQNQHAQTLQTIVVTGSHIRRVDLETSNPVVVVSAKQIAATGALTLGNVIQNLPGVAGGVENPTVNNGGGSGSSTIGLRGLGSSRTLILVDGQRLPYVQSGTSTIQDLNFIPVAAVERIEVLTDGASAVYGSDAIGGVVNIILKSNFQGAQFQGDYGISDHDDGARRGGSFMFGQTSDKGSILAGVDYQKFDEIEASQRKFSESSISLFASQTNGSSVPLPTSGYFANIGGSSRAARGFIIAPQTGGCASGAFTLQPGVAAAGTSPTALSDYQCYDSKKDAYNYASVNLIMTPQERIGAFFKGVYHLSENVDAYATYVHQKTTSAFQLAPQVLDTQLGLNISADSYYNPFGVPFTATSNLFRARLFPAGNREQQFGSTKDMLLAGLRGNLSLFNGQNWTWDVGINYGHVSRIVTTTGVVAVDELNKVFGPSMLIGGVPACVGTPGDATTEIAGCTPLDPFNLYNPETAAGIKALGTNAITNLYYLQKSAHADASGGLFELPAGTVQLAAGVSYNKQYSHTVVGPVLLEDPTTLTCPLGTLCTAPLQGGYTAKEAYAEVLVPVLKDMPLVKSLNLSLGDRYSKYDDVGSTNNWKTAIEYKPIDDVMLRGTVTTVFRAPSVANIYGAPVSSSPFLSFDPCTFDAPTPTTPNPNAGNPACKGVPATGSFVNGSVATHTQLTSVVSGAKFAGITLKPESGKTFDFGVVYSPHFIPGLSLTADVWRTYLNNTITVVSPQTELLQCFYTQSQFCSFLPRIASGTQQGQPGTWQLATANLGRTDVKGVDVSGNYKLPQFSFGQFDINLNATYLTQFKLQTAPGQAGNLVVNGAGNMGTFGSLLGSTCVSVGALCFYPRVRATGSLGWQLGPWNAQWTMRYISRFKAGSLDPSQYATMVGGLPGIVFHYGATVYNNLQVGYNIEPLNTSITVGVDNVFDKQPPFLYANNSSNANTDPGDFDMLGRYYWGRVTVKF